MSRIDGMPMLARLIEIVSGGRARPERFATIGQDSKGSPCAFLDAQMEETDARRARYIGIGCGPKASLAQPILHSIDYASSPTTARQRE